MPPFPCRGARSGAGRIFIARNSAMATFTVRMPPDAYISPPLHFASRCYMRNMIESLASNRCPYGSAYAPSLRNRCLHSRRSGQPRYAPLVEGDSSGHPRGACGFIQAPVTALPLIHTDVIIRLLTGDDPAKQPASARLFEQSEARKRQRTGHGHRRRRLRARLPGALPRPAGGGCRPPDHARPAPGLQGA